jgi:HD-GYP domain-containing protein (c-di-GMP phosphodiesterase class II)
MGKVSIPPEVLLKEGSLTDEEFELMKKHTLFGRDILMSSRNLFNGAVDVAYAHHENIDGSGYPRGLLGHQLSQNTKIVAVADRYDAITSERVYQKGRTHMEAITILNKTASKQHLDASLTMGFVATLGVFPAGSIVELTSGEIAIVLSQNPQQRLRPQILVVRDSDKHPVTYRYLDLAEVETGPDGAPYKIKAMHHAGSFGIHLADFQTEITKAFG